jgi:hypothetical protein
VQKNNCLNCEDIAGLEKIKLCEIQFLWGGAENETEIRKASDVFEAYAARKREFPSIPKIIKARFEVKFSDSKTTRKVTVSGHNTQCVRDSDTDLIEKWLSARGFATGAEPIDGKVKALSELLGDSGGAAGNDGKLGGLGTAPGDGIFIDVPAAAKDRKTGQRATRAGTASE